MKSKILPSTPCSQTNLFRPFDSSVFSTFDVNSIILVLDLSFNLYLLRLPTKKGDEFGSLNFSLDTAKTLTH